MADERLSSLVLRLQYTLRRQIHIGLCRLRGIGGLLITVGRHAVLIRDLLLRGSFFLLLDHFVFSECLSSNLFYFIKTL